MKKPRTVKITLNMPRTLLLSLDSKAKKEIRTRTFVVVRAIQEELGRYAK